MNINNSSWVEISKSALLHNLKLFLRLARNKAKICPVLKANAYGHDMIQAAKTLQNQPIWGFGVVNLAEGLVLRKNGLKKPILVLSYVNDDLALGVRKNIDFPVYHLDFAKKINKVAGRLRKKVNVHVKIDIGTSRLGIKPAESVKFLSELNKLQNLKIKGVFAHFADSENKDWTYTNKQLDIFNRTLKNIAKAGFNIPFKHVACSAAALGRSRTHFDLIRLGISLYGLWPSTAIKNLARKKYKKFPLKPSLSWQAKIVQIKTLPANSPVGYGLTYRTNRMTKIAVIPVGYYEGYDRHLSNKGEILLKEKRCPILGRICMNMFMVDISRVKNARAGDTVTLIGRQGNTEITADELAKKIGTINYEVVTRINPLIPRLYV